MVKLNPEYYCPVLDEILSYYLVNDMRGTDTGLLQFKSKRFIENCKSRLGEILDKSGVSLTIGNFTFDDNLRYDNIMIFVLNFERFIKNVVTEVRYIMGLNKMVV